MSKPENYTQCELRQPTPSGYLKKVCWIPTEGAVTGNTMKLDGVHGVWTVVYVGTTQPAKLIINQAHNSDDIWKATSGPNPRGNK